MTTPKIESGTAATSTTAAESLAARPMPLARRLIIVAICAAGLAWLAGPVGRMLVVLPLLLFGPGYLIERVLTIPQAAHFPRLALWMGLSLSAVALAYEWATALGLALTPLVLGVLAITCGLAVIWQIWQHSDTPLILRPPRLRLAWSTVALLVIFALTLWTRFYQIRDLALPAWVDSVHHALMIRVAAELGQAPLSLRPYLPVDQLPYHWGYHVFVAAVMQLSGLDLPQSMLWSGQVLNALQVLAVAGLATYLWRRPVAGVGAALVVGLLSSYPAYYVSWGRYTQLTGLLLLPALLVSWLELLRAPSRHQAIMLALLLAGMSLIHFVVLAFALVFMLVSGLIWLCGERGIAWRSGVFHAATSAVLALALAGPWLWVLASRVVPSSAGRPQVLVGAGSYFGLDANLLWAGQNRLLIALALLAALWGLRRHRRAAAEQIAWVAALVVVANLWLALYVLPAAGIALLVLCVVRRRGLALRWRLALAIIGAGLLLLNPLVMSRPPYFALITTETVVISLFLPIGVLVGGGAALLWESGKRKIESGKRKAESGEEIRRLGTCWVFQLSAFRFPLLTLRIGGSAVLAGLALWGAWNMRDIVNPATVIVTPGDVVAIDWVTTHTPADARFLINAAPWLGTGRGADGGWWLLPLAGRWTSTPPVLYDYAQPDYVRETRARTQQVIGFRAGQEQALYQMIDRDQIGYVYLGPNPKPLTPAQFPASQGFEKIYERDGVTIFAVHRS